LGRHLEAPDWPPTMAVWLVDPGLAEVGCLAIGLAGATQLRRLLGHPNKTFLGQIFVWVLGGGGVFCECGGRSLRLGMRVEM